MGRPTLGGGEVAFDYNIMYLMPLSHGLESIT